MMPMNNIETKTITAKTRKLTATWTLEDSLMLRPVYGIPYKIIGRLKSKPSKRRTVKQRSKWLMNHFVGKENSRIIKERIEFERRDKVLEEIMHKMALEIRNEIDNEILTSIIGNINENV